MPNVVREINNVFKFSGLTLQKEAVKSLETFLLDNDSEQSVRNEVIKNVLDSLKKRIQSTGISNIITDEVMTSVINELYGDEKDYEENMFNYYDAFSINQITYDPIKHTYISIPPKPINCPTLTKIDVFKNRYELIRQHLLHNELFQKPILETGNNNNNNNNNNLSHLELQQIDSLMLSSTSSSTCYILGLLNCNSEDNIVTLEDPNGRIVLDISNYGIGLFTDGCIVIVEGCMNGDIFTVTQMGNPILIPRIESLQLVQHIPILGLIPSSNDFQKLYTIESEIKNTSIIVISECHLDKHEVLDKFNGLFYAYQENPPSLFILMGSFVSKALSEDQIDQYKLYFDHFSSILQQYDAICQKSSFLFIPGPNDISPHSLLPQRSIPKYFVSSLEKILKHVTFGSNPCRIRYFTKEIVIFRDNLYNKMLRSCINSPDTSQFTVSELLIKTIIDQHTLCPLSLNIQPRIWSYEGAFSLFPIPDILILGDEINDFQNCYEKCVSFNPGRFCYDASFVTYNPGTENITFSKINK